MLKTLVQNKTAFCTFYAANASLKTILHLETLQLFPHWCFGYHFLQKYVMPCGPYLSRECVWCLYSSTIVTQILNLSCHNQQFRSQLAKKNSLGPLEHLVEACFFSKTVASNFHCCLFSTRYFDKVNKNMKGKLTHFYRRPASFL